VLGHRRVALFLSLPLYRYMYVYRIVVTLWDDSIIPNWGNYIILTGFTLGASNQLCAYCTLNSGRSLCVKLNHMLNK
jgi:hypothetical protein